MVPDQHFRIKNAELGINAPTDRCECGKSLDYVFEVEFPVWFVDAGKLASNTYWLESECVMPFAKFPFTNKGKGAISDSLKQAKLRLKKLKDHGAV